MHNVGKFSYIKYMKVCSQNKLARQTLINQKSTSYFLQKQVDKTTEKNLGENVTFIRLILSVKRGRGGPRGVSLPLDPCPPSSPSVDSI